jgi:hypothetical protein
MPTMLGCAQEPGDVELPTQASVNGKYSGLLQTIHVPGDEATYGKFCDWGAWSGSTWAGHTDLPAGYWVYATPNWYIWQSTTQSTSTADACSGSSQKKRDWGPEQATGEPDTWPRQGDITTAWASLTADEQEEWLVLEYADPIVPSGVRVYETFNPGSLSRIAMFQANGAEKEVWKAGHVGPTDRQGKPLEIKLAVDSPAEKIKLYLDSAKVPGWNEIDAVALIDSSGESHWAVQAAASSTYASRIAAAVQQPPPEEQLRRLEARVRSLEEEVRKLKERPTIP